MLSTDVMSSAPPHDDEAEQSVLGGLMFGGDGLHLLGGLLKPAHFYHASNRAIFEAMVELHRREAPIDPIGVRDLLGDNLEAAGGYGYLLDLSRSMPTGRMVEYHAGLVVDKAMLRALLEVGKTLVQEPFVPGATGEALRERALALLGKVEGGRSLRETNPSDLAREWVEVLEARANRSLVHRGCLDTGLYDLDQALTMEAGDLVILGARPAMGKSAMMLSLAWAVGQYAESRIYSLEMKRAKLMDRLAVALDPRIDGQALKLGTLDADGWNHVMKVQERVATSGMTIVEPDNGRLSMGDVRREVLKLVAAGKGPALVAIDYLGLMDTPKADRHDQALGQMSREAKLLAGEANCVVMLLVQLNREVEKRPNKRPLLSDLKDSGDIEAHADVVLFPYRDDYYASQERRESKKPGICEVIIAKYRNGSPAIVDLEFEPHRQRFKCPSGPGVL